MTSLAEVLGELHRLREAEKMGNEALALNRAVHGEIHQGVATALNGMARILWYQKRLVVCEVSPD